MTGGRASQAQDLFDNSASKIRYEAYSRLQAAAVAFGEVGCAAVPTRPWPPPQRGCAGSNGHPADSLLGPLHSLPRE